jgi:hypothetical protein
MNAVRAVESGDGAKARETLKSLTMIESLLDLTNEAFGKLERFVDVSVLQKINRFSFEAREWSLPEKEAAAHFHFGRYSEAAAAAAGGLSETWHFSEWHLKPPLAAWATGGSAWEFAGGCASICSEPLPEIAPFEDLFSGIQEAREGNVVDAMLKLYDLHLVMPERFLTAFISNPVGWVKAVNSLDGDLKAFALGQLWEFSPSADYRRAVKDLQDAQAIEHAN